MVIHSASDPRPRTTLCGDYFYNYFTRGLDILFDGQVCAPLVESVVRNAFFYNQDILTHNLGSKKLLNHCFGLADP